MTNRPTFAPPKKAVIFYEDTRRYREGRKHNCPSCNLYKPINCHKCGIFLNRDGKCARGHQFKQNCKLCGRWLHKDGTCTQFHDGIGLAKKHRLYAETPVRGVTNYAFKYRDQPWYIGEERND